MAIPTFIINLNFRTDRKVYIEQEFVGRDEFDITIVEACRHDIGAIGLWESIQKVIRQATSKNLDYVLICEDDHQFTGNYSPKMLYSYISNAKERNADILCGGVSWFGDAVQVSDNLFWTSRYTGNQFLIVFNKFFAKLLAADFQNTDLADYKISSLSNSIFFIHPFISKQKEFGYSDVTLKNNGTMRVEQLFTETEDRCEILKSVTAYYKNQNEELGDFGLINNITIPTYILNSAKGVERYEHIIKQFEGKEEFNITIIDLVKHKMNTVGLWLSIRKIVKKAMDNDEDVIIICEDDHEFTEDYCKEYLLKSIIEAHEHGLDYLCGGVGNFGCAIPVTLNRYWVNLCSSVSFIVVYRKFFSRILDEPFDETVIADIKLSEMTSHKMVLYPFISVKRDFGYFELTERNNQQTALLERRNASERLRLIKTMFVVRENVST